MMELGCHSKKSGNVQTGDRDDENSVQESKRLETSSIKTLLEIQFQVHVQFGGTSRPPVRFPVQSLRPCFRCLSKSIFTVTALNLRHCHDHPQEAELLETQSTGTLQWCFEIWCGFLAFWPRYYSQVRCEGSGELTPRVRHQSPPLVPTYLQLMSTNWIPDNMQLPSDWVTLLIAFLWVFPSASKAPVSIQQV